MDSGCFDNPAALYLTQNSWPTSTQEDRVTSRTAIQGQAFILRADVVATVMGEGAVLLDLRTKYFYSANKTAWAILSALEAGADFAALTRACGECTQDVASLEPLFGFLASEGLVEPAASAGWDQQLVVPGEWIKPVLAKHKEPLQRIMMSAFDPSVPLAE